MNTTLERKTGAGLAAASGSASPRENDKGVRRQYFEAAPNKMFTELTRACVRFVRYEEKVPCALCGKQSKKHWTCAVRFKAANLANSMFEVKLSLKYFEAGAPVCDDHLTQPDEKEFLRKVRAAQRKQNDPSSPTAADSNGGAEWNDGKI
jgi:hypothetical protein